MCYCQSTISINVVCRYPDIKHVVCRYPDVTQLLIIPLEHFATFPPIINLVDDIRLENDGSYITLLLLLLLQCNALTLSTVVTSPSPSSAVTTLSSAARVCPLSTSNTGKRYQWPFCSQEVLLSTIRGVSVISVAFQTRDKKGQRIYFDQFLDSLGHTCLLAWKWF